MTKPALLQHCSHFMTASLLLMVSCSSDEGGNGDDGSTMNTTSATSTTGTPGTTMGTTDTSGTGMSSTSMGMTDTGSQTMSGSNTDSTSTSGAGTTGSGGTMGSGGATGSGGSGGMSSGAGGSSVLMDTTGAGGSMSGAGGTQAGGDTWQSFAMGFFQSYCVSCHNADGMGVATRDYTMPSAVASEATAIACGLAKSQEDWSGRGCSASDPSANQFPAGNGAMPSDAERDQLIAWIDAGMP